MASIMLIILASLALLLEFIIYRSLLRHKSKPLRVTYIAQGLTITTAMIVAMLVYPTFITHPTFMGAITWVVLLFITSFFAKLSLCTFIALRWLAQKIWRTKKMNGLLYAGYSTVILIICIAIYGAAVERRTLRVEYVDIYSDKVPASFDGFRIAQFSDVHIGNFGGSTALIEDLVEQINAENPDVVVQSGDLVNIHSDELDDEFMAVFAQIKAPTYSVLGNHDLAYYIADTLSISPSRSIAQLLAKKEAMRWQTLQNQSKWIHRGADSILIGGVTFAPNHHHNGYHSTAGGSNMAQALRPATKGEYTILIAHSPTQFDSISQGTPLPDLMLSGHTHAMQFKLNLGKWHWSPASWGYNRYSGLYEEEGRKLYINDGLGYVVFPFRFGARPELTILTLHSKENVS